MNITRFHFKWINFLIGLLLFLILYLPTLAQPIKLGILVVLFLSIIFTNRSNNRFTYSKGVLIWLLIYVFTNFFFLSEGALTDSTVMLRFAPVNIIWPLLYLGTLVTGFSLKNVHFNYVSFFNALSIIIPVFIIGTFFEYTYGISNNLLSIIFPTITSDYGGFINYFAPSITSLFFLGSWSLCIIFAEKNINRRLLNLISAVLIIIAAILVGRRALLLTLVLGPIIFLLLDSILFNRRKRLFQILILIVVVGIVGLGALSFFSNQDLRIFNLSNSAVQNNYRTLQLSSLIDGWETHPLFGSGFGINASVVRSAISPGTYELSYVALLFQSGIVGVVIYFSLYIWIFIRLNMAYIETKNMYYLIVNVGYLIIMLMNATNPYINSFDGLWIIFFCLALINRLDIQGEDIKIGGI